MQEKRRVKSSGTEPIISLGRSKRLARIRKSVEVEGSLDKDFPENGGCTADRGKSELQQAREIIRQSIAKIKAGYRQGMQNRLFALRFGADEEINQMTLEKLFKMLNINQRLARDIAKVRYEDW